MSRDRLDAFVVVTMLLAVTAYLGVRWLRAHWSELVTDTYPARHAADLPRPGDLSRTDVHPGPGQPDWDELTADEMLAAASFEEPTEAEMTAWLDDLNQAEPEETQPFQAFHDDQPDGPVIATAVVGGVWLPLSEDVPRPASAADRVGHGRREPSGPGYPFQPHTHPPPWRPARDHARVPCRDQRERHGEWVWAGEWVRTGPPAPPWLQALYETPLRALEAAA